MFNVTVTNCLRLTSFFRDPKTLAVHGLPKTASRYDVEEAFPKCSRVNIAKRGGSGFVQFNTEEHAR